MSSNIKFNSNRRKLDTPDLNEKFIKRIKTSSSDILEKTKNSDSLWPEEDGDDENDRIFSNIRTQNLICNLDENNEFLQCTQRFLDDLNKCIIPTESLEQFDCAKFFSESIYETSEDIFNKTVCNKNLEKTTEFDVLTDMTWHSAVFSEDEYEFPSTGPFFGLPQTVEQLIYEHKGIKNLYEWQIECLNLPAIQKRKNLIYALPTSGGKTLVAEILMLREIICRRKNVIMILPYVSIVQEKVSAMAPFALSLNFLVEEYTAGKGKCPPPVRTKRKSIFIASIEKGALLFDSLIESNRANEIGLVVIDELHLIGEKGRGATLETLLTKIMILKAGIQIIGMSATIGNLSDISSFLDSDVYTRGFRPVELKEYIKCGDDILSINPKGCSRENLFEFTRTVNFKYSPSILKIDPDHLAGLVSEVIPQDSCLIFCPTRKNCENVAVLLTKVLSKKKHLQIKQKQRLDLIDAIEKICGIISPTLIDTIPYGVAYHHSGLTTDERKLLEIGYRVGTLCVICCTSTLAAGVNLPAKRVIIRAPYVGREFMTLCQYKQMVGRAGRAGMGDTGESFLICSIKDNLQVGQMLFSPMDKVLSSLTHSNAIGLQALILSSIGLQLVDNLTELENIAKQTLLAVQSKQLEISVRKLVTDILKIMFRHNILKVVDPKVTLEKFSNSIITTQELTDNNLNDFTQTDHQTKLKKLVLSRSTKFELSMIGRAAFKAGIDYKRTELIYNELVTAQKSLVLTNNSHLLYLIISLNNSATDHNTDLLNIDPKILFHEYNKLDQGTREMTSIIGITEAHAVKMYKTLSLKGPVELQFIRLYKVLLLCDVINLMPLHLVSSKYNYERGIIQNLISQSVAATSCVIRLCEEISEFWCFKALFEKMGEKLDRCCTAELIPLLELPAVKINRARQLYAAGFKTIEDIAKSDPKILSQSIDHMPFRTAKEIVSASKLILLRKLESLEEETEAIKSCLNTT